MVAPGFGVDVGPCSVLAVRSPFGVAFPSDWLAALVSDPEGCDAVFGSQYSALAPAPAEGEHTAVEIGFGSFLAWPSAVA